MTTRSWIVRLVLLLAFCAAGLTGQGVGVAGAQAPDIEGRWVSAGCEMIPGAQGPQYVRRDLRLTSSVWIVVLTIYADPQCAQRTLEIFNEGPYFLGSPSAAASGATDALFVETEVRLTPRAAGAVDRLNSAPAGACGLGRWALDASQSVTATGCAPLGVVRPPFAEYELVKREGETLFLGARPPAGSDLNAPERRPTALNAPLVRTAAGPALPNTGGGGLATGGGRPATGGAAVVALFALGVGYAALRRRKRRAAVLAALGHDQGHRASRRRGVADD